MTRVESVRSRLPAFRPMDLAEGGALLLALAAGNLTPSRGWPALTRLLGRFVLALRRGHRGTPAETGRQVRRIVGDRPLPARPETIRLSQAATNLEGFIQMARAARGPGFGRAVEIVGRERLDRALAAGRGGVLVVPLFQPMLHFAALPAHGYPVSRVTNVTHGFFRRATAFSSRFLMPVQERLENPAGIEMIPARAGSIAHLRGVVRHLARNRFVIFRSLNPNFTEEARSVVEAPFLDGRFAVSTTPFSIAHDAGSVVLPVYPVRLAPGRYAVVVGNPLHPGAAGDRRESIRRMAEAFIAELSRMVLRHPDQWAEWDLVAAGG